MDLEFNSSYRVDIPIDTYYIITDDNIAQRLKFPKISELDVKGKLFNPFQKVR